MNPSPYGLDNWSIRPARLKCCMLQVVTGRHDGLGVPVRVQVVHGPHGVSLAESLAGWLDSCSISPFLLNA